MSGEYHVGASKGGYVDRIDFGNRIGLTETQHERSVDLRLARGAVLSGRVIDADGEPEVGVQVVALAEGPTSRGRRGWSMAAGGVATDDRGMFRIFGLAAGEYILVAQRQDRSPARSISRDGRNADVRADVLPGHDGARRGTAVSLDEAAEYSDLTFATQTLPSVSVSGRVVVSSDRIRHGFTTMHAKRGQAGAHDGALRLGVMVEPDGTFRIPLRDGGHLPAGRAAWTSPTESRKSGSSTSLRAMRTSPASWCRLHGPTTLTGSCRGRTGWRTSSGDNQRQRQATRRPHGDGRAARTPW